MRLATIRTAGSTTAVRIDGNTAIEIDALDVGALLARADWREFAVAAKGRAHGIDDLDYAPVVVRPGKILCAGLNYRAHIAEVNMPVPEYPTLFAKFAPSLIGAHDVIELPGESTEMDWEAELAVVIGSAVRRVDVDDAAAAIAGYAVVNDVSARDWQMRTPQWLQGKTFEKTTPFGPHLVTLDEVDPHAILTCHVGGDRVQKASIDDLVFTPGALVSYISTFITLEPGDVILTGTPGGVGIAANPQRWLADGDVVRTGITGIGECRNTCRTTETMRTAVAP